VASRREPLYPLNRRLLLTDGVSPTSSIQSTTQPQCQPGSFQKTVAASTITPAAHFHIFHHAMSNAAAYGSANGHGHDHDVYDHAHDNVNSIVGEESLSGYIDHGSIICLNEETEGMGKNPFKHTEDKLTDEPYLESDADEQLLIHVPFSEAVCIKSICFVGHQNGQAPRDIKMWVNKEPHDIDFPTAEESDGDQEIKNLHQDVHADCYYFCKRDRFNSVSSVTIFVSANYGADTTRINYIGFKGEFGKGKRRAVEAIYEVSGSALDAKLNSTCQEENRAAASVFTLNKFS
jgi:hypothetical protein